MGYFQSSGKWVSTKDIRLDPLVSPLTIDGKSAVVEMGSKRALYLNLVIASVSTDDTLDVTVETSNDGTNWYSAGAFTQATSAGGAPLNQRKMFVVDRFVRADFNVGGAAAISIPCTLRGEAV